MTHTVTDILELRMREGSSLSRMVVLSLLLHGLLLTGFVLAPADWRGQPPKREAVRMTISLGGAPGPNTGGMTQMSDRPVQAVAPPEPKARVETPPAPKAPEMTIPDPALKSRAKPAAKVDRTVDAASARKPTTGPQIKSGDARVNTGAAPIPFGGLSSSGGGGTGGVQLDVSNFCCPDYIVTMQQRIRSNWNQNQGAVGRVGVKFTIRRDGTLVDVEVEKPANNYLLDNESRRAILYTRQLPPLPTQFTEASLTVHLIFEYLR